ASFYGAERIVLLPPDTAIPDLYRVSASLRAGTKVGRAVDVMFRLRYAREASMGLESQTVPGLDTFLIDLPERSDRLNVRLVEKIALAKGHALTLSLGKQWFWNESKRDRQDSPLDEVRDRFHTMHGAEATGSFFEGQIVSFLVGARGEIEQFNQKD